MENPSATIQLITFGGLKARGAAGEPERLLAQHSRAALLVYLAVERRVSRESLLTVFWPESDAENARHALRQSMYQLRKIVGADWVESRAHELVVLPELQADAHAFMQAVERGDAQQAVELYQGPFLDGVHLVDLQSWESWVDSRRTHYARAFRKACRELLESKRAAGDVQGSLAVAERWASRDPVDDEAQHRLIEALAHAGERAEAVRQYETYARLLEPDGLVPRDETTALVERLRREARPLPTMRTAPAAAQASVSASVPIRARRALPWILALVVAVALLAWTLYSRRADRSAAPATPTIAVLPFSVRGSADVRYLADGMVNLLGSALDGAGSLRPVDTRATFAAVGQLGDTSRDARQGHRIAARLGARLFVLGDAIEAGNQLQLEAAVYDADARCAEGAECPTQPRAKAVVTGAADSIFALVDVLAARLLGGLGDPAADRLMRTASITTTSLQAFKEYLNGEEEMRAGRFERAAEDYLAAIALDSTFAVAHYRLALAREWAPLPGNADAAAAAARHGARLSPRDQRLLEAFGEWRAGNAIQADRAYRAILARYPDDVDAWFQLGEIQFHHGPLLGRTIDQSEPAWRKVLSYEPHNLFAVTHLARIAASSGRPSTLDSLLAPFEAQWRNDRRLAELLILRAVAKHDTSSARSLAREVARGEVFAIWRVAVFLTAFSPDPGAMRDVLGELTSDHVNPAFRADLLWFESMLDLALGRVADAEMARVDAVRSERGARRRRMAFDLVTDWFAATLPLPFADSVLMRARERAASARDTSLASNPFVSELEAGTSIQLEPIRQYSLGTLSLRLRDMTAAATAASTLERLAASPATTGLTRDLDRGLRAHLAFRRGDARLALALLDSLEYRDSQGDVAVTPFASRANERYLHAEVLASLGRDADALRWLESLGIGSVTEVPLRAVSHLRQAELHEKAGNRPLAAEHYSKFLELWTDADPQWDPARAAARQRLASLSRRH